MNKKQIKGVLSEHLVICDLLKKGFWVFSPHHRQCPVDLIAISAKGVIKLFDVKTKSIRRSGRQKNDYIRRTLSLFQKKLKVQLVYVDDKGKIVYA